MRLSRLAGLYLTAFTLATLASTAADAQTRSVCSGKKGGFSHCDSGKFVCNDGTRSRSKRICEKNADGAT